MDISKKISLIYQMDVSPIASLNIPNTCDKLISKMKFSNVVKYANNLGYNVTVDTDKKDVYSFILYSMAVMFFVLPSRIIYKDIMRKRLEDMELEDGEACPDDKKLMKVINIGHFLGSGKYGAVYSATLNPTRGALNPSGRTCKALSPRGRTCKALSPRGRTRGVLKGKKSLRRSKVSPVEFVLKLSAITKLTYSTLKKRWKKSHPWNIPFGTKEIVMHYLVNTLLTENICPNFIFMYHWYLCNKCSHLQVKRAGVKVLLEPQECIIYILEKVDGDLVKMVQDSTKQKWSSSKKEKIYKVAIFQTIMALAVLQQYYAIDHYDAGLRNIFYKKIHKLGGSVTYWAYKFYNNTYYVPNPGYMFFLADYGLSQSLRILGQSKTADPSKSLVGVVGNDRYYRKYDSKTDEITYSPDGGTYMDMFDPQYNSDKYHTQDKGLAVLTKELGIYFKNGEIQDIQDYLNQIFIDKTGKSATYLLEKLKELRELESKKLKTKMKNILGKNLVIPPVDYSEIFEDIFKEWKTPPKDGICIGVYDSNESLPFNVDEKYMEILEKIY